MKAVNALNVFLEEMRKCESEVVTPSPASFRAAWKRVATELDVVFSKVSSTNVGF